MMKGWLKFCVISACLLVASTLLAASPAAPGGADKNSSTVQKALKGYRVSPGDVLSVQVFGEPTLSDNELNISAGGDIALPLLGEVNVVGKTAAEIEAGLLAQLRGGYLVDPKVSVTIRRYRAVYVNGQVKTPSSFPFEPGLTVRKAVSKAGGLTERASTRKIYVISEGRETPRKVKFDSLLRPGDIVTIEESFF